MRKAILILIFAAMVISAFAPDKADGIAQADPLTKEELAKQAEEAARDNRLTKAMHAGRVIKNSLRDPDSLKWQTIRTNDDATVLCYVYRARNGFGGMNLEHAAVVGTSISTSAKVWKRNCQDKNLHDVTGARHGI